MSTLPPGVAKHELSPAEVTAALHTIAYTLEALTYVLEVELSEQATPLIRTVRDMLGGMRDELGLLSSHERGFSEN